MITQQNLLYESIPGAVGMILPWARAAAGRFGSWLKTPITKMQNNMVVNSPQYKKMAQKVVDLTRTAIKAQNMNNILKGGLVGTGTVAGLSGIANAVQSSNINSLQGQNSALLQQLQNEQNKSIWQKLVS